jgi:hypothetical protein
MDGCTDVVPTKKKRRLLSFDPQEACPSYPRMEGENDVTTATSSNTTTNSNEAVLDLNQQTDTVLPNNCKNNDNRSCTTCLQDTLLSLIAHSCHGTTKSVQTVSWRHLSEKYSFFAEYNSSSEATKLSTLAFNAVRAKDAEALKELYDHKDISLLMCRSRFGESLLHMACRRGHLEIVMFLIEEGVPVRIVDNSGRTPLHDACWTTVPQLALVEFLIRLDPELLLVKDDDDLTPLQYVPQKHALQWEAFLYQQQRLLHPFHEAFYCDASSSTNINSNSMEYNNVSSSSSE